jgi:hypothetical protein
MSTSRRDLLKWSVTGLAGTMWRGAEAQNAPAALRWLPSRAYHVPSELTTEESGYQSLGEGLDGRIYIGAAKYGFNGYLVEFDPKSERLRAVVDVMKTIGSSATGFAAQAKIHSHLPVSPSGKIYCGSKQGYPKEGEKRTDYPGGYPLVYDPATGTTKAYPIPIPHQGIISHFPDEARGLSYISTCDDARPAEVTHFMVLDLKKGTYKDLGDMGRSYAYIQRDYRGRALHLASEARVAAYDPDRDRLQMLQMLVEGARPQPGSRLYENHPLQPGTSPDGKTLYLLPMEENALYAGDLTRNDGTLPLRRIAPVLPGAPASGTDCRSLDVDRAGRVWAMVRETIPSYGMVHHLCVYDPPVGRSRDVGIPFITNPEYESLKDETGKPKPWHHGVWTTPEGRLTALHHHMAIKAARDGTIYTTVIAPFTLLRLTPETIRTALGASR